MKAPAGRLLAPQHSWSLRPHRHTSYAGLLFVLMLTGVILTGYSVSAGAAAGGLDLSQAPTLSAPPPNIAANPYIATGTCPAGAYVTLRRNNIDAGLAPCSDSGTYTMKADLFMGANTLVAQARDISGRQGPASNQVTTQFGDVVPGASQQLFLQSSGLLAAGQVGSLARRAEITGGTAPYAVSWDWGDGNHDLATQSLAGTVTAKHSYAEAKTYAVTLLVSDANGVQAVLPMVGVISAPGQLGGSNSSLGTILKAAWPIYAAAVILVISFWLGDVREKATLKRRRA